MKIHVLSLFLLALTGCFQPPKTTIATNQYQPIELSFRPLTPAEKLATYSSDSINLEDLQAMQIKNNGYDSLFFPLYKLGDHLVYLTGDCDTCKVAGDSIEWIGTRKRYVCSIEVLDTLLKGDSFTCYFKGACRDADYVFRYVFPCKADSAGTKSFPDLKKFPCGINLPVKQRN